jgi:cytochrome c oxidase subunit 4
MNRNIIPKKIYFRTWLALIALLWLTWGIAQINLGRFNAVAALTIAVIKLLLVVLFFMQVRYKPSVTWIFAAAGFIWLAIMIDLTMSDYLTRGRVPGMYGNSWEHGEWPTSSNAPAAQTPR